MAKSSKREILKDEQKVLLVLEENSNESIGEIAEKCGFSRQKAWRIIKRLEDTQSIWGGYHACVDNEKMDRAWYILLFRLKHLPIDNDIEKGIIEGRIDDIAKKLDIRIEDNLWLHGTYDWMISFYARNIRKAKQFHELLSDFYQDNIIESELLENMIIIRKNGFMNPRIKKSKSLLYS